MVQGSATVQQASWGKQTYGGYSTSVVVDEKFVLRIPENLDEATTTAIMRRELLWSPLRHWNVKKNKVGVLRGLNHMGVKFANALEHMLL
jgi:uncharacterized zinc-type alcohol dehydrogenase-like protein